MAPDPQVRYARSGAANIAYQVVGDGPELGFEERGPRELRGVPGEWRLYALADA